MIILSSLKGNFLKAFARKLWNEHLHIDTDPFLHAIYSSSLYAVEFFYSQGTLNNAERITGLQSAALGKVPCGTVAMLT